MLDIKNGIVVHGKSGRRDTYTPLASVLTESYEPVMVAKDLAAKLNSRALYVADLDAIDNQDINDSLITEMSTALNKEIILDAGVSTVEKLQAILKLGNIQAVIGTETIASLRQFDKIAGIDNQKVMVSVDYKNNRVLSKCPQLREWEPFEVVSYLVTKGFYRFILLDLGAVGTGNGVNTKLVHRVITAYPKAVITVGGGVSNIDELIHLKRLGVAGVLVGTALHTGAIKREDLEKIS